MTRTARGLYALYSARGVSGETQSPTGAIPALSQYRLAESRRDAVVTQPRDKLVEPFLPEQFLASNKSRFRLLLEMAEKPRHCALLGANGQPRCCRPAETRLLPSRRSPHCLRNLNDHVTQNRRIYAMPLSTTSLAAPSYHFSDWLAPIQLGKRGHSDLRLQFTRQKLKMSDTEPVEPTTFCLIPCT